MKTTQTLKRIMTMGLMAALLASTTIVASADMAADGESVYDTMPISDEYMEEDGLGGGFYDGEPAFSDEAELKDEVNYADDITTANGDEAEATGTEAEDAGAEAEDAGNAVNTDAATDDDKGSPDTGVEGVAAVAGIAVLAAGVLLLSGKKSKK